jgi:hypothetical protein
VKVSLNAIQPNHIARHLETGDLISTVIGIDHGFEKTQPYSINGVKEISLANQGLTFFNGLSDLNQLIDFYDIFLAQPHGQTQLSQIAARASKL